MRPTKLAIRLYLQRRNLERSPPPDIGEIRRRLGCLQRCMADGVTSPLLCKASDGERCWCPAMLR